MATAPTEAPEAPEATAASSQASALPSSSPSILPIDSYDTALCIIPPKHLWPTVNHLRAVHDPAYKKWPPHVNLVYPFVPVHDLSKASDLIVSQLQKRNQGDELTVRLESTGFFTNNQKNTVYLHDEDPIRAAKLTGLREAILASLGHAPGNYQMHMTVGQTKDPDSLLHKSTLQKAGLLPKFEWVIDKVYIMIRDKDKAQIDEGISSQMKVWGEIDLASQALSAMETPVSPSQHKMASHLEDIQRDVTRNSQLLPHLAYTFSPADKKWIQQQIDLDLKPAEPALHSLNVASYNIQAEHHLTPTQTRYPIITKTLMDSMALSDVMVLQEVTDDFLMYLCKDEKIREKYPFISNGPPDQADIQPLPTHLNVVVLSKYPFSWDLLSSPGDHKSSVIVKFSNIGKHEEGVFLPVILCGIHLTPGLSNASVEKKKQELQSIFGHLSQTYPQNPWIIAGDFNITTSVYSIESAVRNKGISAPTKSTLGLLEIMLTEEGLEDVWVHSRVQYGSQSYHIQGPPDINNTLGGEEGATFDPTVNKLAKSTVGNDFEKRPQRYARILVKGNDFFTEKRVNLFGSEVYDDSDLHNPLYGSGHWGIRCLLKFSTDPSTRSPQIISTPSIETKPAPTSLSEISTLTDCVSKLSMFPSDAVSKERQAAIKLLGEVVQGGEDSKTRGLPTFTMIPVGSYGLGIWDAATKINCLFLGQISPRTFYALAIQRLRKAAPRGIRILARLETHLGTFLELEVEGIRMDLQYGPPLSKAGASSAALMQSNSAVRTLSQTPAARLKQVHELDYLRNSIPDLGAFELSYRVVKFWAQRRGIYASNFGYLDDRQITFLLLPVCKLLARQGGPISVPTILTTFYNHYASFNWEKDCVFDPLVPKQPSYKRSSREPMVILSFTGPGMNTAQMATVSAVHTIAYEFKRADSLLSEGKMTWSQFLGEDTGAAEFLNTYKMYIKITAQFWGVSLSKGNIFVEWAESRCARLVEGWFPPFFGSYLKRIAALTQSQI